MTHIYFFVLLIVFLNSILLKCIYSSLLWLTVFQIYIKNNRCHSLIEAIKFYLNGENQGNLDLRHIIIIIQMQSQSPKSAE